MHSFRNFREKLRINHFDHSASTNEHIWTGCRLISPREHFFQSTVVPRLLSNSHGTLCTCVHGTGSTAGIPSTQRRSKQAAVSPSRESRLRPLFPGAWKGSLLFRLFAATYVRTYVNKRGILDLREKVHASRGGWKYHQRPPGLAGEPYLPRQFPKNFIDVRM